MDEREELRRELVAVFADYLSKGRTEKVKAAAARVYAAWHNAGPILDAPTRHGVHLLVDLAFETGVSADRARIEVLLVTLRSS
jgi:hypothetical protein